MRKPLDNIAERGMKLQVFFPHNQGARVMVATGETRPNTSRAPCESDWELKDPNTGQTEWVPGWYVAYRTG